MGIIQVPARIDKAIVFIAVKAYLDTVKVFFPLMLRAEQPRTLNRFGHLEPCIDADGRQWGWRLIMNQPGKTQLLRLDPIAKKYRGVLSRVDIAVDVQPLPPWTAASVQTRIVQTAILKWRKPGPMLDEDSAVYWVYWEKGQRRPTRNLVAYFDRPDRFTGEPDCVHLELRFLRAETIRRQGIRTLKDLINIDPNRLFKKHVNWAENGDAYVNKVVRKAMKEDRLQSVGKPTSEFR